MVQEVFEKCCIMGSIFARVRSFRNMTWHDLHFVMVLCSKKTSFRQTVAKSTVCTDFTFLEVPNPKKARTRSKTRVRKSSSRHPRCEQYFLLQLTERSLSSDKTSFNHGNLLYLKLQLNSWPHIDFCGQIWFTRTGISPDLEAKTLNWRLE
jgi:hypothetical protein